VTGAGIERAVLVTNRSASHSNHQMLEGLALGLRERGLPTDLILTEPDGRGIEAFLRLARGLDPGARARTLLVDLNGRVRLKEAAGFAKFSFVTDHPAVMLEPLADAPPDAVIGCVDRSHLSFCEAIGLPQRTIFFPHGGPTPDAAPLPLAERDIPLLFVGHLAALPRPEDLTRGLEGSSSLVRALIQAAANEAVAGACPFEALRGACRDRGVDWREFGRNGLMAAIDVISRWVEAHGRRRLLDALSGLPVRVVGRVADGFFDRRPDGFEFTGPAGFDEVRRLFRRTRLLLNSVTVFPDGSHERIWYGMAAGCAVATDPSRFVAEDFRDGESIHFWPNDPAGIRAIAQRALEDPEGLQTIVDAARPAYAARHTWRERAGRLLAAFSP
jgi:glycosyltransferase involved in cell wall biosynthesis